MFAEHNISCLFQVKKSLETIYKRVDKLVSEEQNLRIVVWSHIEVHAHAHTRWLAGTRAGMFSSFSPSPHSF